MEIRGTIRTIPSRPIALLLATLAVLALALTSWYVLGSQARGGATRAQEAPMTNQLPLNCSSDPYSPHDPICQPYHDPYSPHDPLS
ncbi:MAG TPA: hypothetical protein VLK30_01960 [Candidatus Limnocylindrales bacterium]|nr:hypothetical protein [Candidatus Limnocylindrales bacterium]